MTPECSYLVEGQRESMQITSLETMLSGAVERCRASGPVGWLPSSSKVNDSFSTNAGFIVMHASYSMMMIDGMQLSMMMVVGCSSSMRMVDAAPQQNFLLDPLLYHKLCLSHYFWFFD